ncbi:MAG TPA: NADH-quinone oxidoreductase subunit C [Tepidisphaeraceae bacterium]|jgi:NADH-quinone oxidoreductase subunit C
MARTITHPAFEPLKAACPDIQFKAGEFRDMVTLIVPREHVVRVCQFLKTDDRTAFDFLAELNGVDYLGYAGAQGRFCVNYGLTSTRYNNRLWLKVFLDPTRDTAPGIDVRDEEAESAGDPGLMVPSVTGVWPGAEWMEREAYDMFGIIFTGHPDLRRIMTWNGFGSYPLRKDYPLRGVGERENYKVVTREGA